MRNTFLLVETNHYCMSVDNSEAMLKLATAVLKMQDDVKALHSLFLDNVTFIKGMGDVPEKMGDILLNIVEEHDKSTMFAMKQMVSSSEFYKNTISNIYPNMNVIQEWFSEFAKETVEIFTGLGEQYIQDWMIAETQTKARALGKTTAEMSYEERVEFGESMFRAVSEELNADPMCHYVLRTLYIPYISIYFLRPFTDYPYYEEWKSDIKRYTIMQRVRREFHKEHPEAKALHVEFLKRLAEAVNDPKGLIHSHTNK